MKITFLIGTLTGGGAERVTCNLANHFARRGWDVEVLALDESIPCEPLEPGVTHTPLLATRERSNKVANLLHKLFRLRRYLRSHTPDTYVVMLPLTTIWLLQMAGCSCVPILCAERADPSVYSKRTQRNLRKLAPRAAAWVFQTETVRDWYLPHLKGIPHTVIPNAINPAFLGELTPCEREKTIISVGRLCPQKNFSLLIRAFARIAADFPEQRLVIYGKGGLLTDLQALAAELGMADRVDFPGHVDNMPGQLQKAGMYVLSSDYEGMPNALIEAMSQGLPCVATDCGGGGARFLVQDGHNGLLIPLQDEEAMVTAMRRILTDEALAKQLGRNALAVRHDLAPEQIYDRWVNVVEAAIAARSSH